MTKFRVTAITLLDKSIFTKSVPKIVICLTLDFLLFLYAAFTQKIYDSVCHSILYYKQFIPFTYIIDFISNSYRLLFSKEIAEQAVPKCGGLMVWCWVFSFNLFEGT